MDVQGGWRGRSGGRVVAAWVFAAAACWPASSALAGPRWMLIHYRQIGKEVNANNHTFENFLFKEDGSKGSGVGLTNPANSTFAIFGNADAHGYVRVNTDPNNWAYNFMVFQPGIPTQISELFYWQNPSQNRYYTFVTQWLYVSDDSKVTTYPTLPAFKYDLVNGINTNPSGQTINEPPGYDGSDAFSLSASAAYQAQTFKVPQGINRIISAQAFVTRSVGQHFSYRATIRQGLPTGPQIGPAAISRDIASPDFLPIAVNWGINAVPVTPGMTCSLHLEAVDGGGFNAFATSANNYADGHLWNGSTAVTGRELLAVVVGIGYDFPSVPMIEPSPTAINRSIPRGQHASADTFTIRNAGVGTLEYAISDNASWLSVSPTSGSATGETDSININYTTASLAKGNYTGTITINAPGAGNTPQTVTVHLTVQHAPVVDRDEDGDVDLEDFGKFQACLSGSGHAQLDPGCFWARLDDADEDVDGDDLTKFRNCLAGANVQVQSNCAD